MLREFLNVKIDQTEQSVGTYREMWNKLSNTTNFFVMNLKIYFDLSKMKDTRKRFHYTTGSEAQFRGRGLLSVNAAHVIMGLVGLFTLKCSVVADTLSSYTVYATGLFNIITMFD